MPNVSHTPREQQLSRSMCGSGRHGTVAKSGCCEAGPANMLADAGSRRELCHATVRHCLSRGYIGVWQAAAPGVRLGATTLRRLVFCGGGCARCLIRQCTVGGAGRGEGGGDPRRRRPVHAQRSALCSSALHTYSHALTRPCPPCAPRHAAVKIKKSKDVVKFKVRCSKYLYTLCVKDLEKADKLKQSLPPGLTVKDI